MFALRAQIVILPPTPLSKSYSSPLASAEKNLVHTIFLAFLKGIVLALQFPATEIS